MTDRRQWTAAAERGLGDLVAQPGGPPDAGYEIGWGLNLALVASFSLMIASALLLVAARRPRMV